jgi:hypothetical protein
MLGSRLAVYTTSFVMVHAIFINPLENGHAHVLEGVSVFIILVGPYLSVSIERLKTYVLTSSPSPFSFVFSGSLRVDGPSPLSFGAGYLYQYRSGNGRCAVLLLQRHQFHLRDFDLSPPARYA